MGSPSDSAASSAGEPAPVRSFLPAWDGALYAANTAHHRRYDADFLASLPLRPTDRVLDVGCGSGDFTATVAAQVPDGHVVGVDAQAGMVEQAATRARPNQSFAVATAQALDTVGIGNAPFDAVFSRAVFHWLPWADHAQVLAHCLGLLRPGGLLRIECGGGDNVSDVVAFLDDVAAPFGRPPASPWTFSPAGAYLDLLLDAGYSLEGGFVRTVAQRRAFDRQSVLGWLHSQTLQAYEADLDPAAHPAFRAAVDRRIDELRRTDGSYDRTFVRLDLLAHRPAR